MAPKDSSPTSRLGFHSLPPELRLQVYDNYFSSYSHPDAKEIYEGIPPCYYRHSALPLLLVSKQVFEEVLDLLRKRKQYVFRMTGQKSGFDNLALSCLQARKIKRDDYANIPHLRFEIDPPHPHCGTGMMHILDCIQELCKQLGAIYRLHHVSIVFSETKFASWSMNGELRMSPSLLQQVQDEPDFKYVLDLFATLNNMTKATFKFARSVGVREIGS